MRAKKEKRKEQKERERTKNKRKVLDGEREAGGEPSSFETEPFLSLLRVHMQVHIYDWETLGKV